MRRPVSALSILRVTCGCVQTLIGGATILLGLSFAAFGMALAAREQLAAGIPAVGLGTVLLIVAGVLTLLQGVFGVANRHHAFAIGAAFVAVTIQGLFHAVFQLKITPAMVALLAFECATIPVAWLSALPRPAQ